MEMQCYIIAVFEAPNGSVAGHVIQGAGHMIREVTQLISKLVTVCNVRQ